jgi:hypothetical protein
MPGDAKPVTLRPLAWGRAVTMTPHHQDRHPWYSGTGVSRDGAETRALARHRDRGTNGDAVAF